MLDTTINSIYASRCLKKAVNIIEDIFHPGHSFLLLSAVSRRYKSLESHTTRFKKRFFPAAIRPLNSPSIS